MKRIGFYFRYASRNIVRGGRWTTLAIFCIAAGVAAVVALRSLGLSIGETLQSDVRQDNKGDVRLFKDSRGPDSQALNLGGGELAFFNELDLQNVENYVESLGGGLISGYTIGGNIAIGSDNGLGNVLLSQFITTYLIDPQTYPPTHDIPVIEPQGAVLRELFTGGNDIVVSENLAAQQDLQIGDEVSISRTDEIFTVRGIVSTQAEASIRNPLNGFFGFAYLELARVQEVIDPEIGVNNLAIALNTPLTEDNHEEVAEILEDLADTGRGRTRDDTAIALLQRNQTISQLLGDFIVVMGLGALLIGGVGIMNTMLVLVRRRTNEIAAVKTFGMKGRQVAYLFLAEGLLLGIIGSVVGSILGVALSGVVNQFGEVFLTQELVWRIHPEALLYGFTLGIVVTVIFGLAPILTALQIRPGIILRPQESFTANLGILQTIGLMLLVVLLIGLVVGQIVQPSFGLVNSIGQSSIDPLTALIVPLFGEGLARTISPYFFGVVGVAITLAILGVLVLILWVLVWLIGKFPSFGNVELRLALRNLSTQRFRTATTLLALSTGMFALSSITFVGEGTRQLLNLQLTGSFGGNVLAFPLAPGGIDGRLSLLAERNLNRALEDVPGVQSRTSLTLYNTSLLEIDGVQALRPTTDGDDDEPGFDAFTFWANLTVWKSDSPEVYDNALRIVAGQQLPFAETGRNVVVGPASGAAELGIGIGSILTYEIGGEEVELEVIGFTDDAAAGLFSGNASILPGLTDDLSPLFQFYSYNVDSEYVGNAVAALSSINIPPTFAFDVSFVDSLVGRLIEQFAAIPTVVGLLSLFAAAVIMANTVALSTLERRRQIGILKAIGLKSERVLRVMLIESSLIGLLSAVLGIGLSSVFVSLFTAATGTLIPLPTDARGAAVALVVASVLIAWVSTFLSANVAVRERVMNVLRYE